MRLAHYYPRALIGDGGPTNSVKGWAKAMAFVSHQRVMIICAPGHVQDLENLEWHQLVHRRIGRALFPKRLGKVLDEVDMLILHSGWTVHNFIASWSARHKRIPYILTPHGAYDPRVRRRRAWIKYPWWQVFERQIVKNAAAIHVFFASEVTNLRQLGWEGPVIVAPNGIEIDETSCWDGGSGGYLLWYGRFDVEHKGLDLLLEAIRQLEPAERPKVRLHGPDWRGGKEEIRRRIESQSLDAWVLVSDPIYGETKIETLCRAKAFIYPSRWDAHSMAVMEAAALGVPVLTTTTFVGRELSTRRVVTTVPAEVEALAKAIRTILREPNALGSAEDRRRRLRDYTWPQVAQIFFKQLSEQNFETR